MGANSGVEARRADLFRAALAKVLHAELTLRNLS